MKKSFTTLVLFILFSYGLKAQNFVEEVEESKAKGSDKVKVKFEKLKKNENFESVHYINFNELARIQKDGKITIALPNMKEPVELITFRMEYKTDTDYNWYATTKDGFGSVIILRKGDNYTGHFSFPNKNDYQIISEEGQHILIKMKPSKIDKQNCVAKLEKITGNVLKDRPNAERVVPCHNPIRILVLWTQAAENTGLNVNNIIDTAIGQFNNCIYRSSITGDATIQIVGRQKINFYESDDMKRDVLDYPSSGPGSASSLRNSLNADIVVLLTYGTSGNYNDYGGAVKEVRIDPDNAYAIVQIHHATDGNRAFTHEVGHLFDAHHNISDDDTPGQPYAHAKELQTPIFQANCFTMMHRLNPVIDNFSNPNVYVNGISTGTTTVANNARRIGETCTSVRDYRPNPNDNILYSNIDGTNYGYVYQSYTWEAVTTCSNSTPFNYEWCTSNDAFNWNYRGGGEYYSEYLPWTGNNYYYLRLKVTAQNGQVSDSYQTIYLDYSQARGRIAASEDKQSQSFAPISWKNNKVEKPAEISNLAIDNIYPNPTNSELSFTFFNPKFQELSLSIVDVSGRSVSLFSNEKMEKGTHVKLINVDNFSSGLFVMKLSSESETISSKVIIKK